MLYELGVYKQGYHGSETSRKLLEVAQPEGRAWSTKVRLLTPPESFPYHPMLIVVIIQSNIFFMSAMVLKMLH